MSTKTRIVLATLAPWAVVIVSAAVAVTLLVVGLR
jgi:hypothetical protein